MAATCHGSDGIIHQLTQSKGSRMVIVRIDTSEDGGETTVRFNHLTLHEYFYSSWQSWFLTGQVDIADKCLTFINSISVAKAYSSDGGLKIKEKDLPFISYAVQFWDEHVKDVLPDTKDVRYSQEFEGCFSQSSSLHEGLNPE
ncbi:uncharacterized protein RSE6_04595 [Rhynchosporium secalis]|uniref:Uncharacterized protein n=1 Tax=Rhynchosporium secalis TaxID=38038 RepID=A0A1E1M5P2_RHYSE|nr:uncharacterized protein RSE6_04595 [Rhynchosporium secalis]